MKYIPRAEITTIKNVLYPLRKKKDLTWDKKNLQDLKDLKQKLLRLKEEKQKEEENKPEPFKLKQYKNVASKFMDTEDWVIKKQQKYLAGKENNENIYIRNSSGNRKYINNIPKNLNKSASIKKLPKIRENKNKKNLLNNKSNNDFTGKISINNESKSYSSINELINNNLNTNSNNTIIQHNDNNNDFNLEKELEKIPVNATEGPSLFERPMSNSEEIEKLIKDYKDKYGDTEILESLLKEYEEVKQKRKENYEKEKLINESSKLNEENKNYNLNSNMQNKDDTLFNYEPSDENGDKKPPIPTIEDAPLILPKIYKNYVKENIQLISDNKIPQKKYVDINDIPVNKHKNFGKVPEYIKKFEMEREFERQEQIKRREEMKYPKGTRLISEDERVKTLNSLIKTQKELTLLLEKMPITNRSINIQRKKEDIVKKLNELDKAIDTFSKKKVFVKK